MSLSIRVRVCKKKKMKKKKGGDSGLAAAAANLADAGKTSWLALRALECSSINRFIPIDLQILSGYVCAFVATSSPPLHELSPLELSG